jgi:hypothetical protein
MNYADRRKYDSSNKALKHLNDDFNAWSSMLSNYGLTMSYAIIAANWAVHGNAKGVLANWCSIVSLLIVFVFLALNLFATHKMSRLLYKRSLYAERDFDRWEKEFSEAQNASSPWPYTQEIEDYGDRLRSIKLIAPILAAVFFILSLFF